MVKPMLWAMAPAFLLVGCDPFAPADPEPPSNTREALVATKDVDLLRFWGQALAARDTLQINDITSDTLKLYGPGGVVVSNSSFRKCIKDKLFLEDPSPSWSPFQSWTISGQNAYGTTAWFDYSITTSTGIVLVRGRASWTVSDENGSSLGWKIVRWEDLSAPNAGLSAYCQEGGAR